MSTETMASDTSAPEASMEDRVFAKLFGDEDAPADEAQPEASQGGEQDPDADPDALQLDDSESVQAEATPAPADDLEIVYNGETLKVSKSEAKDLAQLGMHHKRNTERFEQQWKSVETYAQSVQQQMQAAPEVQEAQALVTLYERAIQGVDMNALRSLAGTDPAAYVERQAELAQLQYQHQQAYQKAQEARHKWMQATQYQQAQWAQRQDELVKTVIPQWRSESKRAEDMAQIRTTMKELGYTDQELDGMKEARAQRLMYLASKYVGLQKAQGERLKRAEQAPPVSKPGVSQPARTKAAERDAQLSQAIKSAKTPAEKARFIQAKLAARL
jgi:hypothetical protein